MRQIICTSQIRFMDEILLFCQVLDLTSAEVRGSDRAGIGHLVVTRYGRERESVGSASSEERYEDDERRGDSFCEFFHGVSPVCSFFELSKGGHYNLKKIQIRNRDFLQFVKFRLEIEEFLVYFNE